MYLSANNRYSTKFSSKNVVDQRQFVYSTFQLKHRFKIVLRKSGTFRSRAVWTVFRPSLGVDSCVMANPINDGPHSVDETTAMCAIEREQQCARTKTMDRAQWPHCDGCIHKRRRSKREQPAWHRAKNRLGKLAKTRACSIIPRRGGVIKGHPVAAALDDIHTGSLLSLTVTFI